MKVISVRAFVSIMPATSVLAWGGSCHNLKEDTASACESGYVWDNQAQECIDNPTS